MARVKTWSIAESQANTNLSNNTTFIRQVAHSKSPIIVYVKIFIITKVGTKTGRAMTNGTNGVWFEANNFPRQTLENGTISEKKEMGGHLNGCCK